MTNAIIDTSTGEILNAPLTTAEAQQLAAHEATIRAGFDTFVAVGTALMAIRDARLYREEFATFEDYCQQRWDMSRPRAYQLIEAANVATNLSTNGRQIDPPANERQARPLTELAPDEQVIAWEVVRQTAPAGRITAAHVKSVVNVLKEVTRTGALDDGTGEQIAVADVLKAAVTEETYERLKRQETYIAEKQARNEQPAIYSSASSHWYTPAAYVEAARAVMGGIDLDPASCAEANETIQAAHFFSAEDNGLAKEWRGRVWMNPPYSGDEGTATWVSRLLQFYAAGSVTEAVMLINAVTDRRYFQPLWAFPICFTDHRIKFNSPTHSAADSPIYGSALIYMGEQRERFAEEFKQFGAVVVALARKGA